MKKNDIMEIHFVSLRDFFKKTHGKQSQNIVLFEKVEGFRTFASSQKIELLSVLATEAPKSIYELAKLLGRTFPSVWKDCVALKSMGFIKLIKSNDNRGSLKPELIFAYNAIKVFLPRGAYQIQFSKAA